MLEINSMPLLPGAMVPGRAPQVVSPDDLRGVGISGGAFALHKGDKIQFPDEEPLVVSQKINSSENSPVAYYVAVIRNGEKSWLGIGNLTRRDANGLPLGKFQEEMLTKPSFKEIYDSLRGKTIVCGEMKSHQFAVFENGQRTEKTVSRSYPEISYE